MANFFKDYQKELREREERQRQEEIQKEIQAAEKERENKRFEIKIVYDKLNDLLYEYQETYASEYDEDPLDDFDFIDSVGRVTIDLI